MNETVTLLSSFDSDSSTSVQKDGCPPIPGVGMDKLDYLRKGIQVKTGNTYPNLDCALFSHVLPREIAWCH